MLLTSKHFFDGADDFVFCRVWIVAEKPWTVNDIAVEVLLEAQNAVRAVKNTLDTKEVVERNIALDGFFHDVVLQDSRRIKLVKLRVGS